MENASKALIIAGAILLSILIIALGVGIYTSTKETVNKMGDMSEQELMAFNSKFESYVGSHKSYAQVSSLIDAVRTHNNTNAEDPSRLVKIEENDSYNTNIVAKDITPWSNAQDAIVNYSALKKGVKAGKTYTVSIIYTTTGLVGHIIITAEQ